MKRRQESDEGLLVLVLAGGERAIGRRGEKRLFFFPGLHPDARWREDEKRRRVFSSWAFIRGRDDEKVRRVFSSWALVWRQDGERTRRRDEPPCPRPLS